MSNNTHTASPAIIWTKIEAGRYKVSTTKAGPCYLVIKIGTGYRAHWSVYDTSSTPLRTHYQTLTQAKAEAERMVEARAAATHTPTASMAVCDKDTGSLTILCADCGAVHTVKAVSWDADGASGFYGSAADFCDTCDKPYSYDEFELVRSGS